MANLKIHSILSESKVNGPGSRIVIWTQGCSKACKGCFNPETWTNEGGLNASVYETYQLIKTLLTHNTGITITGGDPMEQSESLFYLLKICQEYSFEIAEVQLQLSGLVDHSSKLYAELSSYFLNVIFRRNSIDWSSTSFPSHYFTLLTNNLPCVS